MAVVSGKILSNEKHICIALTSIFGVGHARAKEVCSKAKIPFDKKVKVLTEKQLDAIRQVLAEYALEGDLRRKVSMSVKALIDMGCYRGIRHRRGLPCRGQRSKTNARTCKRRRRKS
jgi:small subunit ribosomal protein S13